MKKTLYNMYYTDGGRAVSRVGRRTADGGGLCGVNPDSGECLPCAVSAARGLTGSGLRGGFTLIEVVVVALLLSVLALGIVALFLMFSRDSRELTADFKLQRQYDGLMDDLGRHARAANYVIAGVEAANVYFDLTAANELVDKTIVLTDNDLKPQRAYRITNNFVEFSANGIDGWAPFKVDSDTVWLADNPNLSGFRLSVNRMQVGTDLTFKTITAKDTVYLRVEKGMFKCRI